MKHTDRCGHIIDSHALVLVAQFLASFWQQLDGNNLAVQGAVQKVMDVYLFNVSNMPRDTAQGDDSPQQKDWFFM